jgi:hypothetical protein
VLAVGHIVVEKTEMVMSHEGFTGETGVKNITLQINNYKPAVFC